MLNENHTHTTYSDGNATPKQYCELNKKANLNYDLIFTDHVNKETKWFDKYKRDIDNLKKKYAFDIAAGIEVKILDNGKLNTTPFIYHGADVVIASVHSFGGMSLEEMSKKKYEHILGKEFEITMRALNTGDYFNILGHPLGMTTRLFPNSKPPMLFYKRILNKCKRRGIKFEYNPGYHDERVLKMVMKEIRKNGYKYISPGSDAHRLMDVGSAQARINSQLNILVSQAGSSVTHGIIKELLNNNFNVFVVDSDGLAPGLHMKGVTANVIPKVTHKAYMSFMKNYIKRKKIDYWIVGGDIELDFISKNKNKFGCKVLISDNKIIQLGLNKVKTKAFCNAHNIKTPLGMNFSKTKKMIIKPVIGWGSNDMHIANNEKELGLLFSYLNTKNPKKQYVVEQYINGKEITCGVIKTGKEIEGIICLERIIKKGTTVKAWVSRKKKYYNFVENAIKDLNVDGPMNVQLLDDGKEIYLMEINPRFSGTTGLRNKCGFKSVTALIGRDIFKKKINRKSLNNFEDKTFTRYYEDLEVTK